MQPLIHHSSQVIIVITLSPLSEEYFLPCQKTNAPASPSLPPFRLLLLLLIHLITVVGDCFQASLNGKLTQSFMACLKLCLTHHDQHDRVLDLSCHQPSYRGDTDTSYFCMITNANRYGIKIIYTFFKYVVELRFYEDNKTAFTDKAMIFSDSPNRPFSSSLD